MDWEKIKLYARFFISSQVLSLFNPFILGQVFAQNFGQLKGYQRHGGRLPDAATYQHQTPYHLPFDDSCFVVKGGIDPKTSHSWLIIGQRYAYDFVRCDETETSHAGNGRALRDYYVYETPILAPADGLVVAVRDGVRDHPKPGTGFADWRARDFRGNFVVIRHAEREYSFLAHLKPGSLRVAEGTPVERGQVLGLCGNSGHSTEPHLHFHLQDHPDFYQAVGLPIRFSNIEVDGLHKEEAYLTRGQRVCNVGGDAKGFR